MITPKYIDGTEGSNVSFKCVHNGTGLRMAWRRDDDSIICMFATHESCSVLIITQEEIACTCEKGYQNETIISLPIPNISRADHNTSWFFTVTFMTEIVKQHASLFVKGTYSIKYFILE
jgi:hypothetical protein